MCDKNYGSPNDIRACRMQIAVAFGVLVALMGMTVCGCFMRRSERKYLDGVLTLNGHAGRVDCVVFSPDGKSLASVGSDGAIKLWDVVSEIKPRVLKGHSSHGATSVAFSPDGKHMASGGYDKAARIWDTATGKELLTLSGHSNTVVSVAFSPDGKHLASGSDDLTVKLWDTVTGRQLLMFGVCHTVSVVFSPDGKRLAACGGIPTDTLWMPTIQIWPTAITCHELCRSLEWQS